MVEMENFPSHCGGVMNGRDSIPPNIHWGPVPARKKYGWDAFGSWFSVSSQEDSSGGWWLSWIMRSALGGGFGCKLQRLGVSFDGSKIPSNWWPMARKTST